MVYYYFRNGRNSSIYRVFAPFIKYINEKQCIEMPCYGASITKVIRNLIYTSLWRDKRVIHHVTGDVHYISIILPKNRTILTIHDMGQLTRAKHSKLKYFFIYLFWFYLPIRHVKYVTCISEFTKRELLGIFPWADKKVHVIPNPVSEDFHYSEHRFNKICPLILHIGVNENKNLVRVIKALSGIKCRLFIIGKLKEEILMELKEYKIDYDNAYNISDSEIVNAYRNCDIVSFPSMYEGFGMPVLEGFATGRIVVTSDIEPINKIAANGAILVNPLDVNSITDGFNLAINNEQERNEKIKKGREITQSYTPKLIASKYQDLYTRIGEGSII